MTMVQHSLVLLVILQGILHSGIAQLSDAACDVTYEERSSCDDVTASLNDTQCLARGCCYDDSDASSPYTCWQPAQQLRIEVINPTNGAAKHCYFPFLYQGEIWHTCVEGEGEGQRAWCSLTANYDMDLELGECISKDCRLTEEGSEYMGDARTNQFNHLCWPWEARTSDESLFPDETLRDASMKCRNPFGFSSPSCYNAWGNVHSCGIPMCSIWTDLCSGKIHTDQGSDESDTDPSVAVFSASSASDAASDAAFTAPGAWCPDVADAAEWLQMDFGESFRIWAVMTQGNGTAFVTSYTLATSRDSVTFTDYTERGVQRVFAGNVDASSPYANSLYEVTVVRYVRLYPLTWDTFPCLSIEFVGCPEVAFCANITCVHGVCDDVDDICVCDPGWTGATCEEEIDECLSSPCINGGTCTDILNGYTCACLPEFPGIRCDDASSESCAELAGKGYESGLYKLRLWGTGECVMDDTGPRGILENEDVLLEGITSFEECFDACMDDDSCVFAEVEAHFEKCFLFYFDPTTSQENKYGEYASEPPTGSVRTAFKRCMRDHVVHCDFSDPIHPITTIGEEKQFDIQFSLWSEKHYVDYDGIAWHQINQLKDHSESCTQHLQSNCFAWYASRTSFTFLDGETLGQESNIDGDSCNCLVGNCVNGVCGCNYQVEDRGDITYAGLPILWVNHIATAYISNSVNTIMLGPLKCVQTATEYCSLTPCENGGECDPDTDTCSCPEDYEGNYCRTLKDWCADSPCIHGSCTSVSGGYQCSCEPGYEGENCETDIDECASGPCLNFGSCNDAVNHYACTCPSGTAGDHCQFDINECETGLVCVHGTCENSLAHFSCTCDVGYNGELCDTELDECESEPCQHGGACTDLLASYGCDCAAGYEGTSCEIDSDECSSFPCMNGGECVDGVDSFTCTCQPGYQGDICETEINECASSPCLHGGVCSDLINQFSCLCQGYEGPTCEIEIDMCESAPCQNGGFCGREGNHVTCTCLAGYEGEWCEIDINECDSEPCVNGGECEDRISGFKCHCVDPYGGQTCDSVKVDGSWSGWSEWGACSNPCGNGMRLMERQCDNPMPQNGGLKCPGNKAIAETCVGSDCTNSDGNWGGWGSWTACSQTCNVGLRTRQRECNSPPQSGSGKPCVGESLSEAPCIVRECGEAVDGAWSAWSSWSACDVTCGVGMSSRRRQCDSPPPVYGGKPCAGPHTGYKPCMKGECHECSAWGEWGDWSDCSATCGNGKQSRSRECTATSQKEEEGKNATTDADESTTQSVVSTEYEHSNCEIQQCPAMECYHCNSTYDGTVGSLTCKGPTKTCTEENAKCMYTFDLQSGVTKGCMSTELCSRNVSEKCSNVLDQTIAAIKTYESSVSGPLEPHPDTLYQMWNDLDAQLCTICCSSSRCNRGVLPGGNSVFRGVGSKAHSLSLLSLFAINLLGKLM